MPADFHRSSIAIGATVVAGPEEDPGLGEAPVRNFAPLTLALVVAACGGGGGGGGGGSTGDVVVTGAFPDTLYVGVEGTFLVQGSGFGSTGDQVTIRFEAESGTPFSNGASSALDISGIVRDSETIDATYLVRGVRGSVPAFIRVLRTSGASGRSASTLCTLEGHTVTGFTPGDNVSWLPAPFVVTGTDFRPIGGTARVRLLATSGTPILDAAGAEVAATVPITSATSLTGVLPPVRGGASARVEVILPNSARTLLLDGAATIEFRPSWGAQLAGQELDDDVGESVALSSLEAFAGIPGDDAKATNAGAVAVIGTDGDGGVEQIGTLYASDATASAAFGSAVAVDGDWLAVGAQGAPTSWGAVYLFKRVLGTWEFRQKVAPSIDAPGFGRSVAMSGSRFIAGSNGSVFVFSRSADTWGEEALMQPGGGVPVEGFGYEIGLDGDLAAVGAPGTQTSAGACCVYRRIGASWALEQVLLATDGAAGDQLGISVAVSGSRVAVGGSTPDPGMTREGVVRVFDYSLGTWSESAKIRAPEGTRGPYTEFGQSVALDGDCLLVGAPGWGTNPPPGATFLFRRSPSGWADTSWGWGSGGRYGSATCLRDNLVMVGAPEFQSDAHVYGGAVFIRDVTNR